MTLSQASGISDDEAAALPLSRLHTLVEARLGRSLQFAPTKRRCIALLRTDNLVELWTAAAARVHAGEARSGTAVPQGAVPPSGALDKFSRDSIKDACHSRAIATPKSDKKGDLIAKLIAGWDIRCEWRVSSVS